MYFLGLRNKIATKKMRKGKERKYSKRMKVQREREKEKEKREREGKKDVANPYVRKIWAENANEKS